MSDEILDVFDANLNYLGTEERIKVHIEGLWHQTFHLWIVSEANGGSVLYQRRADSKKSYPGLLDISAAGHLAAGETPEDGIREVQEELGISLQTTAMTFLGYRVEVADETNGYKNREHQAVYMARLDLPLSAFNPDPAEVNGIVWVPIIELERVLDRGAKITAEAMVFDEVGKSFVDRTIEIEQSTFLPRIQRYYTLVSIMAERMLSGRLPISV